MAERSIGSCSAVVARSMRLALLSGMLALATATSDATAARAGRDAPVLVRPTGALAGQAKGKPRPRQPAVRGRQTRRGIVQAVLPKAVVLKLLDGNTLTVPVDARTRVLVNGKRAALADVEPGFVAIVVWRAGTPAQELKTFSLAPRHRPAAPSPRPSRPH